MTAKKINPFTVFFQLLFISYFLYYYYILYYSVVVFREPWTVGDWLINYQDGGFKRRGLLGSFVFFIQDIIHFKLEIIVYVLIIISGLFFLYFTLKLLSGEKYNVAILSLFLSPLTFQFVLVDPNAIGKKEILLFSIFSYIFHKIKSGKVNYYLIIILLFVATLIHEYFIFFIGYLFLSLYYNGYKDFYKYFYVFLSCLVPIILIYIYGGEINEGNSFFILNKRGLDLHNSGIMAWKYDEDVPSQITNNWKFYQLYLISFLIGLVHFGLYIYVYKRRRFKNIMFIFLIIISFSIPLFYFATDWGRWLNIHFTLFLLTILTWRDNKHISFNDEWFFCIFIMISFLWGFNHFGNGFHFYTKCNILVLKIVNILF